MPRAGLEPAASRSSVLHSPKLSYRGVGRPDRPGRIKNRSPTSGAAVSDPGTGVHGFRPGRTRALTFGAPD